MSNATLPLGVFDSGVGGLTVVQAIQELLPSESIVYLGDTARVPYGNKSPETIVRFAREDCAFLLKQQVKAIVVACNTASAHALAALQEEIKVPIFGVIEPGVEAALQQTKTGRIGIIGTTGTINSQAYQNRLKARRSDLFIIARPTPLLVPMVEEDWLDRPATRMVLEEYLEPLVSEGIDTLVLACTHYPLLKKTIAAMLGPSVALVDSASTCAHQLKWHLYRHETMHRESGAGETSIYLTDLPASFSGMASRFLGHPAEKIEVVSLPQLL
jgi:glutamate racemase